MSSLNEQRYFPRRLSAGGGPEQRSMRHLLNHLARPMVHREMSIVMPHGPKFRVHSHALLMNRKSNLIVVCRANARLPGHPVATSIFPARLRSCGKSGHGEPAEPWQSEGRVLVNIRFIRTERGLLAHGCRSALLVWQGQIGRCS